MTTTQDTAKPMEVTYTRYYNDAVRAINAIGNLVIDSNLNKPLKMHKGRSASTQFEKQIALPALLAAQSLLMDSINKEFADLGINTKIVSFAVDDAGTQTEAESRSWADFSFTLEIEGERMMVPVNIKYTSGSTKDNVGGWAALGFCLFGSRSVKPKQGVKGVFEDEAFFNGDWLTAPASDYFILSFGHGEGKATDGFKVSSLLTLTGTEKAFNNLQSFPVQAKLSGDVITVTMTAKEARTAVVLWMIENKIAKLEEELARWKAILETFKKVTK